MTPEVQAADHALCELALAFDFLLAVTPVNVDAAWAELAHGPGARFPALHYRPLGFDPALARDQLAALPLDAIADAELAQLLRDKRRELDLQLAMVAHRDTPQFRADSLQLYPAVDPALLAEAHHILATVSPAAGTRAARAATGAQPADPPLGALAIAARASAELAHYRLQYPALGSVVHVREDVSSLVVSHGDLLVPARMVVAAHRVDALLQHEIGTHVVTYANGRAQPLRILATGLANYEALQEGLAMLAEYVAGGLDGDRLRLVAARVVAVHLLVGGAELPAILVELGRCGLSPRAAFGVAIRVLRGGGLTKDAIYLRGLVQLLAYLRGGGALEPLLVGKLGFAQVPLVEALLARGVLRAPPLRPRWLDAGGAADRLARVRAGVRASELAEGTP